MPTRKRASRKSVSNIVAADKQKAEKELHKLGLNPRTLAALVLTIIGVLLVVWAIGGVLEAFVGLVLIYFGLKMFGFELKL